MERIAPIGQGIHDKCLQCRACCECDELQCPFHAQGNPHDCAMEKCRYCMDFLKRQRLFMNNVG
jgi:hypothetical protein